MREPVPRPLSEIRPLAILAPDRRTATDVARERRLRPREWFYVSSRRSVLGLERGQYLRVDVPGLRYPQEVADAWDYMITRGWQHIDADPEHPA